MLFLFCVLLCFRQQFRVGQCPSAERVSDRVLQRRILRADRIREGADHAERMRLQILTWTRNQRRTQTTNRQGPRHQKRTKTRSNILQEKR